jgi:hypothetical protein
MRSFYFVFFLLLVAAGCSKQKDQAGGTADANTSPPNQPNRTPQGGKKEPPKNDPDSLLADFKQNGHKYDSGAAHDAVVKLRKAFPPGHARRGELFRALVEAGTKTTDYSNKGSYLAAATEYAAKEDVPELIALVNSGKNPDGLYSLVIQRLKELKDPQCVPAAVQWWRTRSIGEPDHLAGELLRAIGPPAQSALWAHARAKLDSGKENDREWRLKAIALLGDIGTADSIPLLREVAAESKSDSGLHNSALAAIKSIQARAAKKP